MQIINDYGDVRLCSWLCDGGIIGNLLDNDINEIFNSEKANRNVLIEAAVQKAITEKEKELNNSLKTKDEEIFIFIDNIIIIYSITNYSNNVIFFYGGAINIII